MSEKRLEQLSKNELIRELDKLQTAARRLASKAGEPDRERLIQSLHVHEVELEMQNRELRDSEERLEQAVTRYSDLYDFAPVGYCTLDSKGRILEINLTGASLLGASREGLVGGLFAAVAPLENRRAFAKHMQRCVRETARVTSQIVLPRAEHGTRVVQLVSDPVRDVDGASVAYRTVLVDISETKALEDRLRLLSDAGQQFAGSFDASAALETIARLAVPALADLCMVDVRADSGDVNRSVVLFADAEKQAKLAERMKEFTPRPGWRTAQGRVIETGEPMLLSAVSTGQRERIAYDDRHAEVLRAADIRSLMVVPLVARGRTIGCLTLSAAESDRRYSPMDLRFAQDLANRAAVALDNARLYDEARRANDQLRVSEAKSSGIISVSADAIISVDEERTITLWNDGAETMFGYSRAEALGASLDMLTPERFRRAYVEGVEQFAAGTRSARKLGEQGASIVGLRNNGEEFPADTAISKFTVGDQIVLTIAVRDMTDQQRVEAEQRFLAEAGTLLASSLEYEDTLTNIVNLVVGDLADFAVLYMLEDDEVRRVRAASREHFAVEQAEPLQRVEVDAGANHIVSRVITTAQPLLTEVTTELLPVLAHSVEHLRALEAAKFKSLIAVPLTVRTRCFGALLLESSTRAYTPTDLQVAEEIGRRMALHIENARLHRAAQRAIRARDDVLGIVAHDLRNPLGTILMEAGTLRVGEGGRRGELQEATAGIQRAANRMKRLIQDLLDVTRIESSALSIERSDVSVMTLLSDFVKTQTPIASTNGLELRLDLTSDPGAIAADRDRVVQVLDNLVTNAERFTEPGGRITIGAATKSGEVLFWVSDTGAGIATDAQPHLFDRFSRGRKVDRMGTGLGLTIVRGIVEAHGGRVWVESKPGAGSTFFFTIPRVSPDASAHKSARPARAKAVPREVAERPEEQRPS